MLKPGVYRPGRIMFELIYQFGTGSESRQVSSPTERVCSRFSGITATAYSLRVLTLPRWERERNITAGFYCNPG